jgi:hypothetical protein
MEAMNMDVQQPVTKPNRGAVYYQMHKEEMKEKMRQNYAANPLMHKQRRNTQNIKKNYVVSKDVVKKYKEWTHHVVQATQLFREMPDELKQHFLSELPTLEFPPIENI